MGAEPHVLAHRRAGFLTYFVDACTGAFCLPACPSYTASNQISRASWHDCLLRDARSVTADLFIFMCHRSIRVVYA